MNTKKYIDLFFVILSCIGILGLMLLITTGVITRSVFSFSIPAAYEITEKYLMPLAIFPALAYAFSSGIVPRVDLFVEKVQSIKLKRIIHLASLAVEFIVFGLFTYFMYKYTLYTIESGNGFSASSINFPLYPVQILITFSLIWLTIIIFIKIVRVIISPNYHPYVDDLLKE